MGKRKHWGTGQEFTTARGQHVYRRRTLDGTLISGTSTRSMDAAKAKWRTNERKHWDSLTAPASSSSGEMVAAYLARWLDERQAMGTLGPRTLRTYRMLVDTWIAPVVGGLRLDDLGPVHVRDVIRHALEAGKSAQWAKHCRTVLSSAMNDALRAELITRNPVATVPSPKVQRKEVVRLTTEQVAALFKFLEGTDDMKSHPMRALFVLALTTGLRQGELLSLYWRDIDRNARTLTVVRTLLPLPGTLREGCKRARRTRWAELEPKTESSRRTIDLSGLALDALREHRKTATSALLVFARKDGRGPLSPEHVTRQWKEVLRAAGLPVVPFHASRHTALAEALDLSGGNLHAAQLMAGHSRISTTVDVYGGLARRATRRIADGMDERYGRVG